MSEDTLLRPCPFCGGDAEFERKGDRRQSTIVRCTHCGASLENGEEWGHGAGWNTRHDLHAELMRAADDLAQASSVVIDTFTCYESSVLNRALTAYNKAKENLK